MEISSDAEKLATVTSRNTSCLKSIHCLIMSKVFSRP